MDSCIKRIGPKTTKLLEQSEKIRNIPNYQNRYLVIESFHDLLVGDNGKKPTNMIVCYMRHIHGVTIEEYVGDNVENPRIADIIVSFEEYLRESLRKIHSIHIWHHGNIFVDETQDVPILGGFLEDDDDGDGDGGIGSIVLSDKWTDDEIFTTEIMDNIFERYYKNNSLFDKKNQKISDDDIVDFKERYYLLMSPFVGGPVSRVRGLFSRDAIDHYMLSVVFLELVEDVHFPAKTWELLRPFVEKLVSGVDGVLYLPVVVGGGQCLGI
jgi:hypothetical protein